ARHKGTLVRSSDPRRHPRGTRRSSRPRWWIMLHLRWFAQGVRYRGPTRQNTFEINEVLFLPSLHSRTALVGSARTAMSMPGFPSGTATSQVTASHVPDRSALVLGRVHSSLELSAWASATCTLPGANSSRPRLHRFTWSC